MRPLISLGLALWLTAGLHSGLGAAQATDVSKEHHPWGRFDPGAWRLVRGVKETFDESGLVTYTSFTDKRTTLLDVEQDGVTLQREVVHEVSGKRFSEETETFKEGFHGERISKGLTVKENGDGHVVIEGRKIACKVLKLESVGPASKTVTTIYYSTTVAPYVLKRQSVTTDLKGNNSRSETTINVVKLDMPCRVLAEIQNAAYVETVLKHPKGTTTTFAVTSRAVPGGVIWHASKEVDKSGRLIRRSLLELADYGLECQPERTGLFGRPRRGFRKTFPLRQP
ncbi:MAG: hypothetical protein ACYSWU_16395 [Planctomycetota bacterium]